MVERFDEYLRREQKRYDHQTAYKDQGSDRTVTPEVWRQMMIETVSVADYLNQMGVDTDARLVRIATVEYVLGKPPLKKPLEFLERNSFPAWQLEPRVTDNEKCTNWLSARKGGVYQGFARTENGLVLVDLLDASTEARTVRAVRAGLAGLVIKHGLPRSAVVSLITARIYSKPGT